MIGILRSTGAWLDERLGISTAIWPIVRHPVPSGLGWWYVFGSATLTLFLVQIFTGICLAMVYVPTAESAGTSLNYLNYEQPLGWVLRAVHNYSASGMIIMVFLHMTQVFLFGAFKYPRELTWLVGVVLLVLTIGLGFTGQVLRWDQDAYWGLGVGATMVGRVPWLGPYLVHLVLGGPTMGGESLSRFFALHVFILPGLLISFLAVHLYLVLRLGISSYPKPGEEVARSTYEAQYEKEIQRGEPFFPNNVFRDGIFSALTVIVVLIVAVSFGPTGPGEPADPTLIHAEPRPDWYFLPLFAILALSPPAIETGLMLGLPLLAIVVLLLVPFFAGRGERSWRRRPVSVMCVVFLYLAVGVLGYLGYVAPWSPKMFAWSGDPIPVHMVEQLSPVELQGAVVFQNKTCRNCHALDGIGGHRGPDLTYVATRLSHNELIRQVLQGGGNMPAFGKQLEPNEVDAVVAFLDTLRPRYDQPAEQAYTVNE